MRIEKMDRARYYALQRDHSMTLSKDEIEQGWHFCPDWDYLLIGPKMPEMIGCLCDMPEVREQVEKSP